MSEFSDYIVYVDESGDHGLQTIDPNFPVFALACCVMPKSVYLKNIVPSFQEFKFRFWGHDAVILHENGIREGEGDFSILRTKPGLRDIFMNDMSNLISNAQFRIIASVIDKMRLQEKYVNPFNPYDIALHFCLERLIEYLLRNGQREKTVHVVFECRGHDVDKELKQTFQNICQNNVQFGYRSTDFLRVTFESVFAKKSMNSTGLQIADLIVRPIALDAFRPDQPNRAMDIIRTKVYEIKRFPLR